MPQNFMKLLESLIPCLKLQPEAEAACTRATVPAELGSLRDQADIEWADCRALGFCAIRLYAAHFHMSLSLVSLIWSRRKPCPFW